MAIRLTDLLSVVRSEVHGHHGCNRKEGKTVQRPGTCSKFRRPCTAHPGLCRLQNGAPLKDWDFIQERILSHDEDMIADFADDIDTLLVFVSAMLSRVHLYLILKQAGLFSAVLTAFLIASLVLLQPDNSQTSVQLLSLLALQNGAPARMQPFLNETAEGLPNSTDFDVPVSVAAINTLWFTSLVVSLAAALFGILAKQWCREYLRWHSVNASPRENVLLRQVRFEAWERWQVASYIAAVPALLQVALILFLVGLFIFVPMFAERTFTAVVSVAIGLTLLGVIILTILPVFSRLCPFQSPTGWAFIRLKGLLHQAPDKLARVVSNIIRWMHYPGRVYEYSWSESLRNRATERLFRAEKLDDWRLYNLRAVTDLELCSRAVRRFSVEQACRMLNDQGSSTTMDATHACIDTVQTRTLVRALSWVRRGSSNDESIHAAVTTCMSSIHARFSSRMLIPLDRPHFLSSMLAMCSADLPALCTMLGEFIYHEVPTHHMSFRKHFALTNMYGPFLNLSYWPEFQSTWQALSRSWERDPVAYEVCHGLVRSDVLTLADDWVSVVDDPRQRKIVTKRIAILLSLLRVVPSEDIRLSVSGLGHQFTKQWADTLEELFRRLSPHDAAHRDGLVLMCVEMASFLGHTIFNNDRGAYRMTGMSRVSLCRTRLLTRSSQSLRSLW